MPRLLWLVTTLLLALSYGALSGSALAEGEPPADNAGANTIEVHHSPTCGCCKKWISHLESNGFIVIDHPAEDVQSVKQAVGLPPELGSCHTARIGGYVVEGHVPADDIRRLLRERPAIAGIAVPGMPVGSPGMEVGSRRDAFYVIAYDRDGNMGPFNHYPAK